VDLRGFLMLICGLLVISCNRSALPLPRTGPNGGKNPTIVPYPPPAARAEIIPVKPGNHVVWVDGSWNWDRRRWVWQKGRWEIPPKGSYYALPKIVEMPDGTIGWLVGGWQKPGGEPEVKNKAD
jgi:WXXGXW repeat (2 copies)